MLREIPHVRQDNASVKRRWYQDEYFDLWTWEELGNGQIESFQLCYDKRNDERALSWRRDHGFDHLRVRTGRGEGDDSAALLGGDAGVFPAVIVSRKLKVAAQNLPPEVRKFLFHKVKAYVKGEKELR